ncbi:MAG: acetamidase/formamidase family protein [Chloroflexi bacterium]|nr:acetamidase/formamidase family protein [Chloroflexota bacterium]
MTVHTLPFGRETLHGHFSPDLPPVLRIADGDSVHFTTFDPSWRYDPFLGIRDPDFARHPELDRGHALSGPVYIEGARPGMTLEIQIGELRPGRVGWTGARLYGHLGITRHARLEWQIDAETGTATDQYGHVVRLSPFMGVMGNAPGAPGVHSTTPPRRVGGNMDLKELVSGSTLYLPIEVDGALFSTGDGHAAQGDGEVSGTAIECPMERAVLTFRLRDDMPLKMPRALTPAGWIAMGFDEDLNKAADQALDGALDLIVAQTGAERPEALALASMLVDLRVTQIVNQARGVHAIVRPLVASN